MMDAARRVVAAVDVPVTVDIEGGYGASPSDVAATVRAVIEAGAVGVNLEDSAAVGGPLFGSRSRARGWPVPGGGGRGGASGAGDQRAD